MDIHFRLLKQTTATWKYISDSMVVILKIRYDVITPPPIVRFLRNLEDRCKITPFQLPDHSRWCLPILFDPMKCKNPNVPLQDELLTWTSQLRTAQHSIFAIQVWQIACGHMYYKIDQHDSSSCKGTFGFLHFIGSNTMIFAVLKVWLIVKSYCLPYLTYCVGALELSKSNIHHLSVCWNDAFRKIFGFKRCESVKQLQFCCGEMLFNYLYYLSKSSGTSLSVYLVLIMHVCPQFVI